MEKTPARAATHSANLVRHAARRLMPAGLLVVTAAAGAGGVACGRADAPAAGADPVVEADDGASQAQGIADPASVGERTESMAATASPAARPSQTPPPLSSPEHERYQQLRLEALRLMIQAAQRTLPIGPFQQRIDEAARTALQDVSAAGDLQEAIVADLREAIAADGR